MRIIAFTGPENLRGTQESYVRGIVREMVPADKFVSGCAKGVDSAAGWEALMFFPDAEHEFVVPGNFRYNVEMVKTIEERKLSDKVVVTRLQSGGPMERNDYMVEHSSELWAFPETKQQVQRSGTWATIRRAQKAKKTVFMYPLDMSGPYIWNETEWSKWDA